MKKSNRIALKGDSASNGAQVKHATRKPRKAAGEEPVKALVERLNDRHFGGEGKPAATRRKASAALIAELRKFLTEKSFAVLAEIERDFGVSIEGQLSGALGTWQKYIEFLRIEHWDKLDSVMGCVARKNLCVLDPTQVDGIAWRFRPEIVTPAAARFYVLALRHQLERPFNEARPMLEGLRDLIEGHPGFADEERALTELLRGIENAEGQMDKRGGLRTVE